MKRLVVVLAAVAACGKHSMSTPREGSGSAGSGTPVTVPFTGHEDMLHIPGGQITLPALACAPGSLEPNPVGSAARVVEVPAFSIDRNPVSCAELKACERAASCSVPENMDTFCDNGTSAAPYAEAQQYCKWRGAALPTVAQWQRAARGPDMKVFPWGSKWQDPECDQGSGDRPCIYETNGFKFEAGSNPSEYTADRDCAKNLRFKMDSLPVTIRLGAFHLDTTTTIDPSGGAAEFRCARQVIDTTR